MMSRRIFSYCCAIIILLLGSNTSAQFLYEKELYDGSPCIMNNGSPGICKTLPKCSLTRENILARYKSGNALKRCGFVGHIEILCCPKELKKGPRIRPANEACQIWKDAPNDSACKPEDRYLIYEGFGTRQMAGGSQANNAEFPYMAILAYGSEEDFKRKKLVYDCGGALISLRYVLTAAHCVLNHEQRVPRWVKMGYNSSAVSINMLTAIHRTIPHPKFRVGQYYHDIALVQVKSAVCIADFRPVCLQATVQSNFRIHPSTTVVAIGYGATGPNGEQRSSVLMKSANLNLVPVKSCNESYMDFPQVGRGIDQSMMCTESPKNRNPSDPCGGDSGSPLLKITEQDHSLIAVTSFGKPCNNRVPSVYTSVSAYINWIESIVWPENTTSREIFL